MATLIAAAGAAILALAPLVFDERPPSLRRLQPAILALVSLAVLFLVVEWIAIH